MARRSVDLFQPPWRERLEDGRLSEEYGPRTPSAYARALRNHANWAYRWQNADPRSDAREVIGYMRGEEGSLRGDVPTTQTAVYQEVYEGGVSVREAARRLGVTRSTVRAALRRLRRRVGANT